MTFTKPTINESEEAQRVAEIIVDENSNIPHNDEQDERQRDLEQDSRRQEDEQSQASDWVLESEVDDDEDAQVDPQQSANTHRDQYLREVVQRCTNASNNSNHLDGFDLRPNFAILKHKTESLSQQNRQFLRLDDNGRALNELILSENQQSQTINKTATPAWFFDIPEFRQPFADFGTRLPPEDDGNA